MIHVTNDLLSRRSWHALGGACLGQQFIHDVAGYVRQA